MVTNKKFIHNNFQWEWCSTCEKYFVRCPKCGNNCCNGGTKDNCGCEEAYSEQDLVYRETKGHPETLIDK